eukprot:TRINITY_DN113182_c0_g1_i1.p1 TRINITY_DN113182_c0_g1~~TRINITY_DN113182_c0_g1_i1.p1  ORF type:complete len:190 (-),score=27.53 TRINITY_DN113182_c0_g1_i1:90-578(-)
MTLECQQGLNISSDADLAVEVLGRRLGGQHHDKKKKIIKKIKQLEADERDRAALRSACAFDSGHAALWLGRAGAAINQAVKDCPKDGNDKDARRACVVDVAGVIGAFGFAASTMAYAVTSCPISLTEVNNNALCAASIIDVIGVAGYMLSAFTSITSTCGKI